MAQRKVQEETVKRTNRIAFALYVGFFAGLIWGAVKTVEFAMKFNTVIPGVWLEPFFTHSFLHTWLGVLLGWMSFILFSVVASLIYGLLFYKVKGPWLGLLYGVFWWGAINVLLGPPYGMLPWPVNLDLNSNVCEFCLYAVWGLFIGYSIAFEFTDERTREPRKSPS